MSGFAKKLIVIDPQDADSARTYDDRVALFNPDGSAFSEGISNEIAAVAASIDSPNTLDSKDSFDSIFGADQGYDYEFDEVNSTTPPEDWHWTNQGDSIYEERFDAGTIYPDTTGWCLLTRQVDCSDPLEITAKLNSMSLSAESFYYSNLILRDSVTGKFVSFMPLYSNYGINWYIQTWDDVSTQVATLATGFVYGTTPASYMKLKKNGPGNWTVYVSSNGAGWVVLTDGLDVEAFCSPNEAGYGASLAGGASSYVSCHWFRVRVNA